MIDSLRETTWTRLQQQWITILLLSAVIITWLGVVASIEPLRGAETIGWVLAVGALYGALLASSHWHGRTALIIDVITSGGLALLIVGRVLPDPTSLLSQPFDKSLWLMNARVLTVLDVLRSDVQWLFTAYLPNTHLFLLLSVFAVWNAAVWLLWCVLRRRRALAGVLPLALLIVIYTSLQKSGATMPVLFIAASVLLLARTAYLRETTSWDSRRVGFPDLIGEDWTTWAAGLAVIIVLLAGISRPEWRNSVQQFLESLRPPPPVEQPTPARAVQATATNTYATSSVPSMGYVGDPFPTSTDIVFYVTTSDAPSGIETNGIAKPPQQQHYWRSAIYDRYTGHGWEQLNVSVPVTTPDHIDLTMSGRYALTQFYQILSLSDDRLLAAGQPVAGRDAELLAASEDATAILPRGTIPQYEITSWVPQVSAQELETDTLAYPAAMAARYLQLPDSVPQRVKDLAARLTQGATSPYDKAVRIQEYLRATYPYKLDVPAPPPDRDVVDYFLFDAPGGFCSYYASAMTVLLRLRGVPARVVTGFATGDYDGRERHYVVSANAAHAWVEVYFPAYGWIEFEPTSSRSTFEYVNAAEPQPDQLPETSTTRSDDTALPPILIGVISALLIGLIGVAGYFAWRRYTLLHLAPEQQARNLYRDTRHSLQRLGVNAAPSLTPTELRAACANRLADQPRLHHAVNEVIALYIRAVFTATMPDRSEVKEARRLWRSAWRDRMRMRWRRPRP